MSERPGVSPSVLYWSAALIAAAILIGALVWWLA